MRYAWAERAGVDGNFQVVVMGKVVKTYSSPANAIQHAREIQRAISNPSGLNQSPEKKKQ